MNPFDQIMLNLGSVSGDVLKLVGAIAYFLAILFVTAGLVMMVSAARPEAAKAAERKFGWLWSLMIGFALFALPETLRSISATVLPQATPFDYGAALMAAQGMSPGACKLGGIRPLLILFGNIAVIRGLIVFRTVGIYGNYSRDGATVNKGLVLCIAGIALIHMQDVLKLINDFTGLNMGAGLC